MIEFLEFQKTNCKNCYKCIRHCPVKSIRFSGNLASVMPDECVLCGQCYVVCPQNAKRIADETEIVGVLLQGNSPVIASVAPSFAAYYEGVGIDSIEKALKKLGFHSAEETAIGATMVKTEYERLAAASAQDIIISSSCHSLNLLVEKHYPSLIGCLAPVMTPMQAHCEDIKRRSPDAKTVFIGPCLSKKDEADKLGIDAALTFDELSDLLAEAGIELEASSGKGDKGLARLFPTNGGILKTMQKRNPEYTYMSVDGIENCKTVLEDLISGELHHCFIEMSACVGSCANGPVMQKHRNTPLRNYRNIILSAGEEDFDITQPAPELLSREYSALTTDEKLPGESTIIEILRQMDKTKPEDELNCGSCGYDTCREKAIAIYQGKADISMCLPYLMEKSERFTNNILDNTPNGIMVVSEYYEIQQINSAALKMLNINSRSDVLGEPLMRIMNPLDFISAHEKGKAVVDKMDYYAEFDRYLELTIVNDKVSNSMIALFRDVSEEENTRRSRSEISRQTVETADKVVEKQMRIVQEIASLLGETAAETKIALTKLKESISDEYSE